METIAFPKILRRTLGMIKVRTEGEVNDAIREAMEAIGITPAEGWRANLETKQFVRESNGKPLNRWWEAPEWQRER